MLIHASMRNPDVITADLWPFALQHSAYIWNTVPKSNNYSPNEILTSVLDENNYAYLKHLHVWGCPTYILNYKLAVGQKLPKWEPRSRRGVYLGTSTEHSSNVPLVLTLKTGSITPQYHVVFDDFFTTAVSEGDIPETWDKLFRYSSQSWDNYEDADENNQELSRHEREKLENERLQRIEQRNIRRQQSSSNTNQRQQIYTDGVSPTSAEITNQRQQIYTDGVSPTPAEYINNNNNNKTIDLTNNEITEEHASRESDDAGSEGAPRRSGRQRRAPERLTYDVFGGMTVKEAIINLVHLPYEFITTPTSVMMAFYWKYQYLSFDAAANTIEDEPTYSLAIRAASKDVLTWREARLTNEYEQFREAALKEIRSLEDKGTWELVLRKLAKDKNILPSTWTLKRKRFPDLRIREYKARFCARGDKQKLGVDYDETYAPVVQWSTIRLLLTMSMALGLKSKQVDYSNAFVQADIDGEVFMELPEEFNSTDGEDYVLKLKKSLYGLKQAPMLWFETLRKSLLDRGFKQSEQDPCLFLKDDIVALVYVDDVLFFARTDELIDEVIEDLKKEFDLKVEGTVTAFLGMEVHTNQKGAYALSQPGLTERIISAVGMENANSTKTPAGTVTLGADDDGPPRRESWNYPSVVGMLLYLAGNTRPDIAFAVHQAARFSHKPRRVHEEAVKRIVRYLIGTKDKGISFVPGSKLSLDAYVDADFAGLWGSEDPLAPESVKSRTGYVILFGGCPVYWKSKLQTLVAVSTMEAEYVALSNCMRELIPLKRLVKEIGNYFDLKEDCTNAMSTVFEDNQSAIALAKVPKMTPRSKHIGLNYHFFREHVRKGIIDVVHVDTKNQIADMLTKGLADEKFRKLRASMLGW